MGTVVIENLDEHCKINTYRNGNIVTPHVKNKIEITDNFSYYYNINTSVKRYEIPINCKVSCSFSTDYNDKFLVYLMNKDEDWRIGKTTVLTGNGVSHYLQNGLSRRVLAQQANKVWILGVYDSEYEALLQEHVFSIKYRIPQLEFYLYKRRTSKRKKNIMFNELNEFFDFEESANILLREQNKDINFPLWERNENSFPSIRFGKYTDLFPSNLIPKYSTVNDVNFDKPQLVESIELVKCEKLFCVANNNQKIILNDLVIT
jgi:hypothetical protein